MANKLIQPVVGQTISITNTPTITASSAYASGNNVGGKFSLASGFRLANGQVTIQDILIIDKANQQAPFTITFFEANPAAGTYTDKSATVFSTDVTLIAGQVLVAAADYVATNGKAVAQERNVGVVLQDSSGANVIYCVVTTTGTPTYVSTSDLIFKFKIYQD